MNLNIDKFLKEKEEELFEKEEKSFVYEKMFENDLIDNDYRIKNNISMQFVYDAFFNNQDYQYRVDLLMKTASKYLDNKSIDIVTRKSLDKKNNNNSFYLPNLLKEIIYSLYRELGFNRSEEIYNIAETLKSIYVDYIEKERILKSNIKGIGERKEDDFFEKIKTKLQDKFGDNFYILRASKFDDLRGVDFVIYYKDELNQKDTPIACIDLGNISSKHFDNKDYRLIDMYDYVYHDYSDNKFKKFFRKKLPIFNVDSFSHNHGYYFEFIKSVYIQFQLFKKIPDIKEDYKIRLDGVISNVLIPSLPKDQRKILNEL